jgi:DNA-binding XRE family transcriptional regulator
MKHSTTVRDGIAPASQTAADVPGLAPAIEAALVNTTTMAKMAAVSARTLQAWVKGRRVPAIKLGKRCIRFHPPSVLAALRKFTIEAVK